jgi:hypothetical protein
MSFFDKAIELVRMVKPQEQLSKCGIELNRLSRKFQRQRLCNVCQTCSNRTLELPYAARSIPATARICSHSTLGGVFTTSPVPNKPYASKSPSMSHDKNAKPKADRKREAGLPSWAHLVLRNEFCVWQAARVPTGPDLGCRHDTWGKAL